MSEEHARGSPSILERLAYAIGIYILFFGCYGFANRLIPIADCADLTLPLDDIIPFMPGFVYPFYLAYVLILMPAFLVRNRPFFIRSAIAFGALIILSCVLFFLVPVYVPRPEHVPATFSGFLVSKIYGTDRPVCGFPSLHVSTSLLAAFILMREYRYLGLLSFIFFVLTSVSTLFIKQHVLLDVLGGVCMASAIYGLVLSENSISVRLCLKAAVFNIRNMTTRPAGVESRRFTESRKSTRHGVEYDLYEPASASGSTFIIVQGLTLQGERDQRLMNFSRALAESGIHAAAIELPALKVCRFDEKDVEAIIALATDLHLDSNRKIGIIAFSLGAGLALVAASDPRVSDVIDPLLLFGPYYSLPETWNSILEKCKVLPQTNEEWDDYIWIRAVLAYRSMELLDINDGEKRELVEFLESFCLEPSLDRKKDFFNRVLKKWEIGELTRQDGDKGALEKVSPCGKLAAVNSRVLILHDKYDNLIAPEQSERIMEELHRNRANGSHKLLITPLLSHVTRRSVWGLTDVFRILSMMGELFRDIEALEDK